MSKGIVSALAAGTAIALGAVAYVFGWIPATRPYAVRLAKASVNMTLIDPYSSRFRFEITRGNLVCGEFNAKNAYGAYSGYSRFVYTGKFIEIDPGEPDIERLKDARLAIIDPDNDTKEFFELEQQLQDACSFQATYLSTCRPSANGALRALKSMCASQADLSEKALDERVRLTMLRIGH